MWSLEINKALNERAELYQWGNRTLRKLGYTSEELSGGFFTDTNRRSGGNDDKVEAPKRD
jgi:hypothetical protein